MIDKQGTVKVPFQYKDAGYVYNGRFPAAVETDGKVLWGIADLDGHAILPLEYDCVEWVDLMPDTTRYHPLPRQDLLAGVLTGENYWPQRTQRTQRKRGLQSVLDQSYGASIFVFLAFFAANKNSFALRRTDFSATEGQRWFRQVRRSSAFLSDAGESRSFLHVCGSVWTK